MLRDQTFSKLIAQYSNLALGDKAAVTRLLSVREQFILKELSRRQSSSRLKSKRVSVDFRRNNLANCSTRLSRTLFDLLNRGSSEIQTDGPTPAVEALVREIYATINGSLELSGEEARYEGAPSTLDVPKIASWLAKFQ